ncbi:MAG: glycosyltransferase [Deltaproteobacteria bacterium]|nr:glycosyltransferase [Deltaproteobacteria bacterium]
MTREEKERGELRSAAARRARVAVAVPVLRGVEARELLATLQSVLDQTAPDVEIDVLVAADAGGEVLASRPADDRVRCHASSETTLGGLLNDALSGAEADWIRCLPPGDRLAPTALAQELARIEERADVAAILSRFEVVDPEGAPIATPDALAHAQRRIAAGDTLLADLVEENPFPLGTALLRREDVLEIGGFDATFAARPEHDLWLRLVAARAVDVLEAPLLRLRWPRIRAVEEAVDHAEHARALVRSLRGEGIEELVRSLGGGERDDRAHQAIARAELARRFARTELPALRPIVQRLVRESRAAGAAFPADEPFAAIGTLLPELARPGAWFEDVAGAVRDVPVSTASPSGASSSGGFPPRVRFAIATRSHEDLVRVAQFLEETDLRADGIDLVVVHARSREDEAALPEVAASLEILRHEGSTAEIRAVLGHAEIVLLVADESHPATAVARSLGIAVRSAWPDATSGSDRAALVRALLREAVVRSAAHASARTLSSHVAESARAAQAAEEKALGTLLGAIGEAAAAPARGFVRPGEDLAARLGEARRDSEALQRLAGTAASTAERTLDKLRFGARLRAALAGRSPATAAENGAPIVSLDAAAAERFLAGVAAKPEATLWVVYTTDPYSETHGQRSTWLARELLARGHDVVFCYWRWHLSDAIPPSPNARVLPVPIDQYFRLQKPLMDLAAAGLRKVFLIEFPDAFLFEQIDLANAHGFVTVYDCVDDWEEFARAGHAHWYDPAVEAHLARHADVVVATHPRIVERLEAMGRPSGRVVLVPNGVDVSSLRRSGESRAREAAPRVVVGYFGHLTPAWFDWDLLRETASARREWSFEIFGPGAPEDLSLPSNVSVPGPVPHAELAERTRAWSVGVVPFRPGPLARAVDPIKLYEYLALGLPAVVVDMPHLAAVPGVTCCARESFAAAIERAVASPLDAEGIARFVAASGWAKRTEALLEALDGADSTDLLKAV